MPLLKEWKPLPSLKLAVNYHIIILQVGSDTIRHIDGVKSLAHVEMMFIISGRNKVDAPKYLFCMFRAQSCGQVS